ncbi:hypothetical protein D3C84_586400 [compost metagenome]
MRAAHQPDEVLIVLRCDQVNIGFVRQYAVDRFLHLRVEVHRVDELHIRVTLGEGGQCQANVAKATAEVLAAMTRDQHHAPVVFQYRQR